MDTAELHERAAGAQLAGRYEECVEVLHRAFVLAQEADDVAAAVMAAFRLAMATSTHGEQALAAGWTSRAEGLVESLDPDSVERGWVAFLRMFRALGCGDFATAAECAQTSAAAGRIHGDADLTAVGTSALGRMTIYSGRIGEGLTLLDDAMVRVLTGELSPLIAGQVFCTAIEGCQEISEFGRVAEWVSALERWCAAQPDLLAYTGQCALHRGQLLRHRGEWSSALTELDRAITRYLDYGTPDAVGLSACEAGDVHRLRGDLDAAEIAYQRAADHGFDPQPGLALLWLAQGRPDAAHAAVVRVLGEDGGPVQRVRLLPAAIEVLLAAGDVEPAAAAAEELNALADLVGAPAVNAQAALGMGRVEESRGDHAGAVPYLRKAMQLSADVPHARARSQLLLGRTLLALGDEASGRRELEAARATFRQLGATPEADSASALLAPPTPPAGLTPREVEVLRLVATGRSNAQIAADLVLSEKTVARHLSNIFGKLDVGSRSAATAFAFENGLVS